jgi:hypothetical protein
MEAIAAVKPGVKTVNVKKSGVVTKSMRDAQTAAEKLGAVIIPIGNGGGHTLVNKAEAERRKLIDTEKEKLAKLETAAFPPAAQPGAKKSTASARVKATKAPKDATSDAELTAALAAKDAAQAAEAATPAEPVVEAKLGYAEREKRGLIKHRAASKKGVVKLAGLSGGYKTVQAVEGAAPGKGQLPAGLLRHLQANRAAKAAKLQAQAAQAAAESANAGNALKVVKGKKK